MSNAHQQGALETGKV